MSNNVLLAFSGGLDTSFCVKYLTQEMGLVVHSAIVNTGGFTEKELLEIEKRAFDLGVTSHKSIDVVEEYYSKAIKYLIYGNVLKNNTYPLSVSAERMFQALAIAEYAKELGVDAIAHGSTGAGNDQVRFDLVFETILPGIQIITPIRDNQLSRQEEIDYLKKQGVKGNWEKAKYSINQGLWGTSVGGMETLSSNGVLPDSAYPSQLIRTDAVSLELEFYKGELIGMDGEKLNSVDAIRKLDAIASAYAIGRDTHVGDTIIGTKGRVGFEAAAPLVIIKAHHLLEKHTLSKWQQHWKEQLANWYGMLLHEGQYLEPVMRNIETFLEDTQAHVTGKVNVTLHPYRFTVDGIESSFDLMNPEFGTYGEMNKGWSGDDVKGFTKMLANPIKIYHQVKKMQND